MRYIIDRMEGEYWILEDPNRKMHPVKKSLLPPDCREGDVLEEEGGTYRREPEETAKRREMLQKKLEKLRKRAEKD